jgi:hypothetical protein
MPNTSIEIKCIKTITMKILEVCFQELLSSRLGNFFGTHVPGILQHPQSNPNVKIKEQQTFAFSRTMGAKA